MLNRYEMKDVELKEMTELKEEKDREFSMKILLFLLEYIYVLLFDRGTI